MYAINLKNPYPITSKTVNKPFFSSQNFYIFLLFFFELTFPSHFPTEFFIQMQHIVCLEDFFLITLSYFSAKYVCNIEILFFISCDLKGLNVNISLELH